MEAIHESQLKIHLDIEEAWIKLENPAVTMEEGAKTLTKLGNEILEIDHENRRIKVAVYNPPPTPESLDPKYVYVCDYCGSYSIIYKEVEEHEKSCTLKEV